MHTNKLYFLNDLLNSPRHKVTFLLLLLIVSFTSKAALIMPGETISVPATDLLNTPELEGSVINDNVINVNFFDEALFTANYGYLNQVIRANSSGSTIIAPQLNFINNITQYDYFIDQILLDGYAGVETNVFYRTDASGDRGPTRVERSGNGNQLFFDFEFPLFVGNLTQENQDESFPINILTNANDFALTGSATIFYRSSEDISNSLSVTIQNVAVPVFSNLPPRNVTSPSMAALMLIFLLSCVVRTKRKYRNA